jgi:uncharacterized protein
MVATTDRRQRFGWIAMLFIAAILYPATALRALELPPIKGYVNDYAGLLDTGTVRRLESQLADLEHSDSTQIVVLTIPSLEGQSAEAFSLRVAEQGRIGQKGLDNGALLFVARQERKVRIEVGYGLEGKLTDLAAGRIIRNIIVPHFKMGRFDQGLVEGVTAMIGTVRGEYNAPENAQRPAGSHHPTSPGLLGLVVLLFVLNLLSRINRGVGAVAGGILAPIAGGLFFNFGWIVSVLLIPVGIVLGLVAGALGSALSFGSAINHRRSGGFFGGGSGGGFGGGFGSGGFSSGGFSGGGGGFGGGGASGDW